MLVGNITRPMFFPIFGTYGYGMNFSYCSSNSMSFCSSSGSPTHHCLLLSDILSKKDQMLLIDLLV